MNSITDKFTGQALSLLRIVTALLFLEHGTSKIFSFPLTQMSGPSMWSIYWIAGILEIIGSLLLLVGLLTRPVALLLAGEMAIGYFMIHAPQSLYPVVNHGDAAILFCFIFLLFAATGPGPWSVEAMRGEDDEPGVEGYSAPGGERTYREEDFGDKII